MTQSILRQDLSSSDLSYDRITFHWQRHYIKSIVLEYLFRHVSFISVYEQIRTLTASEYKKIHNAVGLTVALIHRVVSTFLVDLIRIQKFLRTEGITIGLKNTQRKIQVYLHKLYRLAPVFDYKRARLNAGILKQKLDLLCFWPCITTQVAIIIYATDLLDKNTTSQLLQGNLRILCSCSAYAFHRTRNKIGLNP